MSFLDSMSDVLSDASDWVEDKVDRALYEYSKSDVSNVVDKALGSEPVQNFVETTAPVKEAWEWTADQLAKGPPGSPARLEPEELERREKILEELPEKVSSTVRETVKRAGGVLEIISRPYVLAGLGVVVALAVAAPYVAPLLSLARGK